MIGNFSVGKTCLLFRFVDNYFKEIHKKMSVDYKIRTINVDEKVYKLQIWDASGQEQFKNLTSSYYKGADGFIVVYDITDRDSFNAVHTWMRKI